ncbi:MAG: hypothetical protein NVS2B16_06340 [Chloroflexota bacterium]
MSRRIFVLASVLALAQWVTPSALAGSHVIFQKTSHLANGQLYLSVGLVPGRQYRIDVQARGHKSFSGYGTEFFNGIANHSLFTGNQSLVLRGTTPHSVAVKQPGRGGVRQWTLALAVRLASGTGLTVRLVDVGKNT